MTQIFTVAPNGKKDYFVVDHIGNTRAMLSTDGSKKFFDYSPFGELLTGEANDDQGWIASERDFESRYMNLQARLYDPVIGRFLAVDPLAEIQIGITPYHYCGNDPVNFSDPLGLDGFDCGQERYDENGKALWPCNGSSEPWLGGNKKQIIGSGPREFIPIQIIGSEDITVYYDSYLSYLYNVMNTRTQSFSAFGIEQYFQKHCGGGGGGSSQGFTNVKISNPNPPSRVWQRSAIFTPSDASYVNPVPGSSFDSVWPGLCPVLGPTLDLIQAKNFKEAAVATTFLALDLTSFGGTKALFKLGKSFKGFGRSGPTKDIIKYAGEANTIITAEDGGRYWITNSDGKILVDIDAERVKCFIPGVGLNKAIRGKGLGKGKDHLTPELIEILRKYCGGK